MVQLAAPTQSWSRSAISAAPFLIKPPWMLKGPHGNLAKEHGMKIPWFSRGKWSTLIIIDLQILGFPYLYIIEILVCSFTGACIVLSCFIVKKCPNIWLGLHWNPAFSSQISRSGAVFSVKMTSLRQPFPHRKPGWTLNQWIGFKKSTGNPSIQWWKHVKTLVCA